MVNSILKLVLKIMLGFVQPLVEWKASSKLKRSTKTWAMKSCISWALRTGKKLLSVSATSLKRLLVSKLTSSEMISLCNLKLQQRKIVKSMLLIHLVTKPLHIICFLMKSATWCSMTHITVLPTSSKASSSTTSATSSMTRRSTSGSLVAISTKA